MEPLLPQGTIAVFRAVSRVKRGDIALVNHPELGWIVRSVSAVGRTGRVSLQAYSRNASEARSAGMVAPECVKGRLVLRVLGSALIPMPGRTRRTPDPRSVQER